MFCFVNNFTAHNSSIIHILTYGSLVIITENVTFRILRLFQLFENN